MVLFLGFCKYKFFATVDLFECYYFYIWYSYSAKDILAEEEWILIFLDFWHHYVIFKKITFSFHFLLFLPQLFGYISLAKTFSTLLIVSYNSVQTGILLTVKEITTFFPLQYDVALILGREVYQVARIYHNWYIFIRCLFWIYSEFFFLSSSC